MMRWIVYGGLLAVAAWTAWTVQTATRLDVVWNALAVLGASVAGGRWLLGAAAAPRRRLGSQATPRPIGARPDATPAPDAWLRDWVDELASPPRPQREDPARRRHREDRAPEGPPPPDAVLRRRMDRTGRTAIALVKTWPPRHPVDSLSFLGGRPVAPAGFAWPRAKGADGGARPLAFAAQIDCTALPRAADTADLPRNGVLWFFLPLDGVPGGALPVVRHAPGPTGTWRPVAPPPDMPPLWGDDAGYTWPWLVGGGIDTALWPRSFPKWQVVPTAVTEYATDLPGRYRDPSVVALAKRAAETNLAAHRAVHRAPSGPKPRAGHVSGAVWWPHDAYPLIRLGIVAALGTLLEQLERESRNLAFSRTRAPEARHPALDARARSVAAMAAAARARLDCEAGRDWMAPLSGAERRNFRDWIAGLDRLPAGAQDPAERYAFTAVNAAIREGASTEADACLSHSAALARLVPPAMVERQSWRHLPDVSSDGLRVHKMLGYPADIQGAAAERDGSRRLLLELHYDTGMGWTFGDAGVYQYWIRPDDLAARRFERVELTFECH